MSSEKRRHDVTLRKSALRRDSFLEVIRSGVIFGLLLYHASWQQNLNSVHMKLVPLDFIPTIASTEAFVQFIIMNNLPNIFRLRP